MIRFINWMGSPSKLVNGQVIIWFMAGLTAGYIIGMIFLAWVMGR